ncbi:MAG TPA: hypothetical protein VNA89_16115 [Gemmatimonadaceae bacterium]|nr:hypothetical protein [Gemmatimonadaceae bacterium]
MTRLALALALPLLAAAPAPPPAASAAPQPPQYPGPYQLAVLPFLTGAYGAEWVIIDTRTGDLQRWREHGEGWEVITVPADRVTRAVRRERVLLPRMLDR